MSLYQRPLRSDELMHHKYIDKVRTRNGNWRYIYDDTYNKYMDSGEITVTTEKRGTRAAKTKKRGVQEHAMNRAAEERMERNYHGDRGIERHNENLFNRDLLKKNRAAWNQYLDEEGIESRRSRASKLYKARQQQKQTAAKRASNPVHKTLDAAKKTINKGKSFLNKLFG